MKVLLVGVGTVGEAIARLSRGKPWLETMVLADYDADRAARIAAQLGDSRTYPHERIDASDTAAVAGLASTRKVRVKGVEVAPRDVVAALTPDPATLGEAMVGRAVVGTWVTGLKDGRAREIHHYQQCDAQETLRQHGLQPVAWQTGFDPVIAMELLAEGAWSGAGVLGPDAFDPDPYLSLLDRYGIQHAIAEIDPGSAVATG
ncbi:hypothetical protein BH24CHL8_BH24CHL8_06310 [soil metagenome]